MGLILSIETATPTCSVALHDSGKLKAIQELYVEKSHAEQLSLVIQDLLTKTKHSPSDLDAISISKGPGSYTGLRIGLSTAKGLCYALDIPLIAIASLEAMAAQFRKYNTREEALLCPMLDARRMEVYCNIMNSSGSIIQEDKAVVLNEESFSDILKENTMIFFGDGASKFKPLVKENPNAIFIEDFTCSASGMVELASSKFEKKEFENLAYFEPFYLKPFHTTTPKNKLL